ncbi:glutathione S-transferase N-terminal domain-containing protein [Oceanibaculum indicum]|uniref:Glutathione S-transferase domain-containing protein n=1 Tax=Oceanibaculum indicum P24 TaxID=1207063 RepID=K2J1K1_9PROT|nr:glutathione S-transferase N-terminal domain-containing protein [Oceanibaculum indicum]EKE76866.1 glutathione S-transferase domain-containing protein [Oceanibaculum indicum P24]
MTIRFYDLVGTDQRRMSPYGWRVRMALAHKGLDSEWVPVRFTDKEIIGFSGQKLVPVLVDGDTTIHDSWAIVNHLETAYPDRPSIFGDSGGKALAEFVMHWTNTQVHPHLIKLILGDVFRIVLPEDQSYFRESREKRFGMTLEAFTDQSPERLAAFRAALEPMRLCLASRPYLAGAAPSYADYALFGSLQWARCGSPLKLLDPSDPLYGWRQRLLESFDGMPGKAVGFAA